jgi:hypothetical protein
MAKCEVCENDYDKTFEVVAGGKSHVFDSSRLSAVRSFLDRAGHSDAGIEIAQ